MTTAELYKKANALPQLPGIYIIRNAGGTIIYIGKAKRLRARVAQYFRPGVPHDEKVTRMVEHAAELDVIITGSEYEALMLECIQIKAHRPKYNILLKDDKGYSYIRLSAGEWPRLTAERQKLDDGASYIGPFYSGFAVTQMVQTACDSFLLPRCTRRFPQDFGRQRPCLYAHIGKCMAVCTGKIPQKTYAETVESAVSLIRHGKGDLVKHLRARMEDAAENLDFERAALLRDQISAIEKVNAGQTVIQETAEREQDVIAFARGPAAACAAILRFREGVLADKREFVFHDTTELEALREEFLPRYYLADDDEQVPKLISVDAPPPGLQALEQALSEKRGSRVTVHVPERGTAAKLVQTAYVNAVDRLARESGRTRREDKVLDELAGLLGLPAPPALIESYDISNWGDGTSVCGMVVFENGKPKKAGYRRFKMKTVAGTDDYASMAEALLRRAAQYDASRAERPPGAEAGGVGVDGAPAAPGEAPATPATQGPAGGQFALKPDLILLDGGRGQVSAGAAVLADTGLADVPLFGMVKDSRHRTRGIVSRDGGEIALAMHRGPFTLVTAIQDETHRFAIDYQRRSNKNRAYSSTLTAIPGVGPATAKALMGHFKTLRAIAAASEEQLAAVKGVGKSAAAAVHRHFSAPAAGCGPETLPQG